MAKSRKTFFDRRGFLKGAAAGAAAVVAPISGANAQTPAVQNQVPQRSENGSAAAPSQSALAREREARPGATERVVEHPGSDFMVDVLKKLDLDYLGSNPGSTF